MNASKVSLQTVRRLAIAAQGLDGSWRLPRGKEGVARTIERLGYVQIDTIAVVQRAHHHTLWSRRPDYAPRMLHDLQAVDRRVFEYWTHAAAIIPVKDYRFYLPRMRAYADSPRVGGFLRSNAALVKQVLDRIRREGPLGSADFDPPPGRKRGSWWDWKPAKRALEFLFWTGQLMVGERRNFQRMYDLTERVLPADADTRMPTADEMARFLVRRTLGGLGVSSFKHWSIRRQSRLAEALHDLRAAGELAEIRFDGCGSARHFVLAEALHAAQRRRRRSNLLHILSPFDNLVIWRDPMKRLFGFDYKLECYVPAGKRRYGYFCLPILWGDQFVGRLDAKADRQRQVLIIHSLRFEPRLTDIGELLPALSDKLRQFAGFNGCKGLAIEQVVPGRLLKPLTALAAHGAAG